MRLDFLVFVFWLADGHCGIITSGGLEKGREYEETGKRKPENGVKYDDGSRSEIERKAAVHERALGMPSGSSRDVKQKRCCPNSVISRLGSPYYVDPEPLIGLSAPAGIQRRDIQSVLTKRLCTTCLTRASCKLHQKCEQCNKWCTPEEISSITTAKLVATGTPVEKSTAKLMTGAPPLSATGNLLTTAVPAAKESTVKLMMTAAPITKSTANWITSEIPVEKSTVKLMMTATSVEKSTTSLNTTATPVQISTAEVITTAPTATVTGKLVTTATPMAPMVETPVATTVEAPMVGSRHKKTDAPIVRFESRFGGGSRDPHMKRIHTVATLRSGNLKAAILKLLGVVDISDIDTVVVWVTTRSNQPPSFDPEYRKSVSPQAERLTEKLNEELDKALEEKKLQYGRNFLTNEEITQVLNSVPIDMKDQSQKNSEQRSSSSEDFLPVYPLEPSGLDSGIPRILNPGVIEDAPDMRLLGAEEDKTVGSRIGGIAETDAVPVMELSKVRGGTITSETPRKIETETVGLTPAVITTKELNEEDLPQSSTKEPLIVSPIMFDSDEDQTTATTEEQTGELAATQNQIEAQTEQSEQNDKLRTSGVKQKIKSKVGKLHGALVIHPKKHRSNEESGESVVGAVEEEEAETEENVTTEQPSPNLIDRLGTFKLIQKIKDIKGKKIQGGYKAGSPYYRANSEEEYDIIGATESEPNIEITTPTVLWEEKPFQDEPTALSNDVNNMSSLSSGDQVKTEDISESGGSEITENNRIGDIRHLDDADTKTIGLPISENHIGDTRPSDNHPNTDTKTIALPVPEDHIVPVNDADINTDRSPIPEHHIDNTGHSNGHSNIDTNTLALPISEDNHEGSVDDADTNTVGSPMSEEASEAIEETPIPIKARTHALLDKIKRKLEEKKKVPQPTINYYREAEDEEIGSPKDESGRDANSEIGSVQMVGATEKYGEGTGPESHQILNAADHDNQGPIKDHRSSSVIIDDFNKAKEVLKDVENLVKTIRKDTNMPQMAGVLGQQQEDVHTGSTTFAPVSFVTDKTEAGVEEKEMQATVAQPQEETKSDLLGSQPLEEVISSGGDIGQPIIKIPDYRSSERMSVGSPHVIEEENIVGGENVATAPKEFPKSNIHASPIDVKEIPVKQLTTMETTLGSNSLVSPEEENRIDINTRSRFSGEVDNLGPAWSNALGKLVPAQQETGLAFSQPKDIFFIGNGIKLPLQMVRQNDGVVHLSVDLDKLCSCRNSTCPKNHTAIEETVGTILEKEAELKDQLAETDAELAERDGEQIDNATERQEEFIRSVNKRSVDKEGLKASEAIHNENKHLVQVQKNDGGQAKNDSKADPEEDSNLSPFLFKQLMDKKITELKSKISNIGRRNELLGGHLLFPQDGLRSLLNSIGREFNRGTTSQEDTLIGKLGQTQPEESDMVIHEKRRGDEIYDETIPIKNVHQFKRLEENLEEDLKKFNEFVDRYTKDHEKVIGEEAKTFQKMREDLTVKKQIDIMNTFIAWMKRLAINKGRK